MNLRLRTIQGFALLILLSTIAISQQRSLTIEPFPSKPAAIRSLQEAQRPRTKSVTLAIAASILLPGLGEYYAGSFDGSGKYALTAEGIIWVSYAAVRMHGSWVRSDARAFAAARSGVDPSGKSDQFEVNLGNFMTTEQYNMTRLRARESNLLYTDPSYQWVWQSDADRQNFKEQRIRSDRILETSKFIIAAAVVNRVISAFSAGKAAAAHNRAVRASFSLDVRYVPEFGLPRAEGAILTLQTTL